MERLNKKRTVSVIKRGKKFVVEYRDNNGNRPRPAFDTEAEAYAEKLRIERRLEGFIHVDELKQFSIAREVAPAQTLPLNRITVKDAIRKYREISKAHLQPRTVQNQKYFFETLWVWLTNVKRITYLDEINLMCLEEFRTFLLTTKTDRGRSRGNVGTNKFFQAFSPFFKRCVQWELIPKSPMDGMRKLPEAPSHVKPWSMRQVHLALSLLPEWAKEYCFFLARTGRRPVDGQRLKWGSVDFERRQFRTVTFKGGRPFETWFPMSNDLYEFLRRIKERAGREGRAQDEDFVLLNSKGRPVNENSFLIAFRKIQAGNPELKGITPYGLRHAFIDALVDMGVQPRDIQLLAGHRKFETTTRYTHRQIDHLREIANRASELRVVTVTASELDVSGRSNQVKKGQN